MSAELIRSQRYRFRAAVLSEDITPSIVDGNAPAQVRQVKCRLAVASVCCTDKTVQSIILRNRRARDPSQNAQLTGAKLKPTILISPK